MDLFFVYVFESVNLTKNTGLSQNRYAVLLKKEMLFCFCSGKERRRKNRHSKIIRGQPSKKFLSAYLY